MAKDNDGRTPLRVAAYNDNLDMVKFFLDRNATNTEAKSNDPRKMMGIVESVRKEIINQADTSPSVKRWAEFFVEKLRYSIKSVAKENLKDGMLHNRYSSVNELANEIYKSDGKLFDDIIRGVIDDVYGKLDTKKILSSVRNHGYIAQLISGYVAVFNTMQKNDDSNKGAVFKLAYYIKETMNFDNYADVRSEKRSDLEKLKSRLPESVKNAVFASKVCIKNTYQNEYLYAAADYFNYDPKRRRAFTWVPNDELNNKFKWKIQRYGDDFGIVNVEFNEHLYAASNYSNYDNNRRMVFTWIPGGQVTQGVWKIEPNGNECNIRNVKHNEYLYAADYAKYDKNRRSVFTWIPRGKVTQGVWRIEDCGSTVRKGRSQVEGRSAVDNTGGAFSFNQSLIEPPVCNISVNNHFEESVDVNSTDENGWTPLHLAAWEGQLNDTRSLVEKGADINAENIFGRKPIHVAAENNNTNIIEFFLSKGMSIDDVDKYGRTPLYCASWNGHLSVVKYLVEKGADINAQNKGGETLLDAATDQKHDDVVGYLKQVRLDQELLIAAQYGNFDEVRDLIGQGASLSAKYSDGMTVMHSAVYGGNLDIVKYFVADAKNSLEIKDNSGRVPLHYAAYNGKLDVIKYFVDEKKVDVNIKDSSGWTALHWASGGGHLDVVEYFVHDKKANIDVKDKHGKTPLDVAVGRNHSNVIKYLSKKQLELCEELLVVVQSGDLSEVQDLVNQGASLDIQSEDGLTLLHFAFINNRLDIAGYLIEKGADINARDKDGTTCLHYVSRFGNLDAVKYLISKDADIDAQDNNGRTPLNGTSNSNVMRVLMQAHLDRELLLTVKNEKDLKTINDLIAKNIDDRTHGGFYHTWSGNLGTVEFLVSKDVSVNATDKYGCTLLHWAALKGHSDIAKFLVDKGANVNAKDILGRTPIHFAVMNNHKDIQDVYGRGSTYTTAESNDEEVIQLFLTRGASINEADKNGETPLHLASWGGHLDTLQHLINNGANISTKDSSGKTPLDIARDKGHNNLVQYLQQTQLILDKQLLIAIGNSDLSKVRGLVAQGANIDTNDKNGNTLLYSAAEIGDLNLVKLLLDNGANIEAKNGEYQATPLHGAVENYRIDVVKLLLSRGTNVNAEDKGNWTPLHYAADTNSLDIVKVLVDAHASLDARGDYGKTPLDIAKDKGHNNIVEYLEKKLREERGKPLQRKRRHHHGDHARRHMSRKLLAIDLSNQPEIVASSSARPSSWINDLFGWAKEKSGELVSGLYRDTTKELENSKSESIQASSNNQQKSKQPDYDRAQEIEFQYMSKYDARRCNGKNVDIHSKKCGNSRQEKQRFEGKTNNKQDVIAEGINRSRTVSNEKQQWSEISHSKAKPTLSHHSDKKRNFGVQPRIISSEKQKRSEAFHSSNKKHNFDVQFKKISGRGEHIVNHNKPMISTNNTWSEKIRNERICNKTMIGNVNQNQQNSYSSKHWHYQGSSGTSKHPPLMRVTAQLDIPSTLSALNLATRLITKVKDQQPHSCKYNIMPKGSIRVNKTEAKSLGLKVKVRKGDITWYK